jgi:hypothetical protein
MTGILVEEDQIVDPAKPETMQPPERPWEVGKHENYACFRLRVLVAETGDAVWSDHELETPEDEAVLPNLLSGGLRQAAYALFTEAMRKEAMYTILLKLQNDPDFSRKALTVTEPSEIEKVEREIAYVMAQTLLGEIKTNAHAVAREALEQVKLTAGAKPG